MVKERSQGLLPNVPPGVPDDAVHQTANLLHSAAVRVLRRARSADTGMNLDGPRASLLSVLVFAGPLSVGRLAEVEQVSPPAVTKTVNALEGEGLVARRRMPGDRRVVMVEATAAGRRLLERGRAGRVRAVAELLAGLPERDLARVHRAAETVARVL